MSVCTGLPPDVQLQPAGNIGASLDHTSVTAVTVGTCSVSPMNIGAEARACRTVRRRSMRPERSKRVNAKGCSARALNLRQADAGSDSSSMVHAKSVDSMPTIEAVA